MGKNNKGKKKIKPFNKKSIKKIDNNSKDKRAKRKIKSQKKRIEEVENELYEDENELYEDDFEDIEDLEELRPEDYQDFLMNDNDIENAPHDPFDIYTIPNTKQEHSTYINELITDSNIIIEVIDARNPEAYRNKVIEKQITSSESKTFLLLFNKIDLISDKHLKELKAYYENKEFTIFTSACNREKIEEVIVDLKKLVILHRKKKQANKESFIQIGIIGYPNTGKESLINGLKLLGRSDPPNNTRYIYFDKKQNYGIETVPGTILSDEIEEANENYKSMIPKSAKDIHAVTSPRVYLKDLMSNISAKTIKEVYSFKEDIKTVDGLLNEIAKKYTLEKVEFSHEDKLDKAALIIIKDIINGKLTYEVEIDKA